MMNAMFATLWWGGLQNDKGLFGFGECCCMLSSPALPGPWTHLLVWSHMLGGTPAGKLKGEEEEETIHVLGMMRNQRTMWPSKRNMNE